MILNEPITILPEEPSRKLSLKQPSRKRSFKGWFKIRNNTSVKTVSKINEKESKEIVSKLKLHEKNNCQTNSPEQAHKTSHSNRFSFTPPQRMLTVGSLRLLILNTKYSCSCSCSHHTITLTSGDDCLQCKINKWFITVYK